MKKLISFLLVGLFSLALTVAYATDTGPANHKFSVEKAGLHAFPAMDPMAVYTAYTAVQPAYVKCVDSIDQQATFQENPNACTENRKYLTENQYDIHRRFVYISGKIPRKPAWNYLNHTTFPHSIPFARDKSRFF